MFPHTHHVECVARSSKAYPRPIRSRRTRDQVVDARRERPAPEGRLAITGEPAAVGADGPQPARDGRARRRAQPAAASTSSSGRRSACRRPASGSSTWTVRPAPARGGDQAAHHRRVVEPLPGRPQPRLVDALSHPQLHIPQAGERQLAVEEVADNDVVADRRAVPPPRTRGCRRPAAAGRARRVRRSRRCRVGQPASPRWRGPPGRGRAAALAAAPGAPPPGRTPDRGGKDADARPACSSQAPQRQVGAQVQRADRERMPGRHVPRQQQPEGVARGRPAALAVAVAAALRTAWPASPGGQPRRGSTRSRLGSRNAAGQERQRRQVAIPAGTSTAW